MKLTLKPCKAIGCNNSISATNQSDFCNHCSNAGNDETITESNTRPMDFRQSSGGDNDYWVAAITHPKRLDPYEAECEDLIEYFQMTFQEGEAFKALWRKGMSRLGNGKPGDTPLRNAQKVKHFGERMIAMEERVLECQT